MPSTIPAAGTLPWRVRDGQLEVALIHRPRYRDWSWPKGKLDPGEDWPVAAARETKEETGLSVRLGTPLPEADYMVMAKDGTPAPKEVRYWAASVVSVGRRLPKDVDQMEWLEVAEAHSRLDYARDREQLLALVQAHQGGWLDTWPLVIVRHAKAVSRSDFKGSNDQLRPLDARGRERAQDLVPLLGVRGITRVVSSPSRRCMETISPYAVASDTAVLPKAGLSEEGFEVDPSRAPKHVEACCGAASRHSCAAMGRSCPPCSTSSSPAWTRPHLRGTPPARHSPRPTPSTWSRVRRSCATWSAPAQRLAWSPWSATSPELWL